MVTKNVAGKIAELHVFNELLKRGATPFLPLVDTGLDAVARIPSGRLVELQIKSAGGAEGRNPRWFQVAAVEPRDSLFLLCMEFIDGEPGDVWVFPSAVFDKYANRPPKGSPRDLDLESGIRKYGVALRDLLAGFRNRWELIVDYERYEAYLTEPTEDLEALLTMREALEAPSDESLGLADYERLRAATLRG